MTFDELTLLAWQYVPRPARFPDDWWVQTWMTEPWIPAHELGHFFVSTPAQQAVKNYGLCFVTECACPKRACLVYECCAMMLSKTWLSVVGRYDAYVSELEATFSLDEVLGEPMKRRARRKLKQEGLWPIPVTLEQIEQIAKQKVLHASSQIARDSGRS